MLATRTLLLPSLLLLLAACQSSPPETPKPEVDESIAAGGAATVYATGSMSYSLPAANLQGARLQEHLAGDFNFAQRFVPGPTGTIGGGLGPLFINSNCLGCHVGDGRGPVVPLAAGPGGLLLRLAVPGPSGQGGAAPVPGYGDQLQTRAVVGVVPEGQISVVYQEQLRQFADGVAYQLRQPTYRIDQPYLALPAGVLLSPRVPPPVFGLGLLEAVPEATLLALADENDANRDGISGRPNYVWDVAQQKTVLGRFGWKANQPSLSQQNAAAYNGDMGVTSPVFPIKTASGQAQGAGLPANAPPDVDAATLASTTFYVQTLGVPARRNAAETQVIAGRALFAQAKCASCHVPRLQTAPAPGLPAETANQTIYPYTDLLLHDMGSGLADGRPDFRATGSEWRTPPLWGLGLSTAVNGHQNLLHDGRARTILEAVLWHGGEAAPSATAVEQMSAADRAALLAFLQSL